jgi:hypothetical protein
VADAAGQGAEGEFGDEGGEGRSRGLEPSQCGGNGALANADQGVCGRWLHHGLCNGDGAGAEWAQDHRVADGSGEENGHWSDAVGDAEWVVGADGKARRVIADIRSLVDGLSESLGRLRPEYYAEGEQEVIAYAEAEKCRPAEVLRAVQNAVAAQTVWQEPGGFFGIREAEVLLPYLLELESRIEDGGTSRTVKEASRSGMRGLRPDDGAARASHRWRSDEQRAIEHSNPLHSLSWVLARNARSAFEAVRSTDAKTLPLLARNIPARVGRLRGYGNAIVPQVAAEFIRAARECF